MSLKPKLMEISHALKELSPQEVADIIGFMINEAIDEAAAAEREACAKIADEHICRFDPYPLGNDRAQEIAAAIRARGEDKT